MQAPRKVIAYGDQRNISLARSYFYNKNTDTWFLKNNFGNTGMMLSADTKVKAWIDLDSESETLEEMGFEHFCQ